MDEKITLNIAAPAEKVEAFLNDYDEYYKAISSDHVERVSEIRDPDPEHPDIRFRFKQRSPVTGRMQTVRGWVSAVEMDGERVSRFDTRFRFPVSLFLRGVDNIIDPAGDDTVFTVVLHFTPLAGLARGSARKVTEHIAGELQEMKAILEGAAQSAQP